MVLEDKTDFFYDNAYNFPHIPTMSSETELYKLL